MEGSTDVWVGNKRLHGCGNDRRDRYVDRAKEGGKKSLTKTKKGTMVVRIFGALIIVCGLIGLLEEGIIGFHKIVS